ncbi:MAG: hypothetical protein GY791_01495 [Alphaproteobacteria bacterium]|nr:hypothetical protein [Alphaproteobacteria bacterium]
MSKGSSEAVPIDPTELDTADKGNTLRAAILGANDGLVSNLSLVMGVAGADFARETVLVTGLVGLLAGACSMAMGEWISVHNSRELYGAQIARQSREFDNRPDQKRAELVAIFQARGLTAEEAATVAERELANRERAIHTLSVEELQIDPHDLGGSPWSAARASFLLFPTGAIFPILPFILVDGVEAILGSIVLSGIALFAFGAIPTRLTGLGLWRGGLRQLVFGLGAAGVAFGVGRLLGVAISG